MADDPFAEFGDAVDPNSGQSSASDPFAAAGAPVAPSGGGTDPFSQYGDAVAPGGAAGPPDGSSRSLAAVQATEDGTVDTSGPMQEVTITGQRQPPAAQPGPAGASSWHDVLAGVIPTVGAKFKSRVAGAQEYLGTSEAKDAQTKLWQSLVLPEAVKEAAAAGIALTEVPYVVDTAKRLGVRVDQFTKDWQDYQNVKPEDQEAFYQKQVARIQEGREQAAKGQSGRESAAETQRTFSPSASMSGWSPKAIVANTLTGVPDLLAGMAVGAAGTAVGGPGVGAGAATAYFVTSAAPEEYAQARNQGASHDTATTYATLSALANAIPEVPVLKAVTDGGYGKKILAKAIGDTFAESMPGRMVNTAASQALAQTVISGAQTAIDNGVLDKNISLGDALKQMAQSALVGGLSGAPLGVMNHRTSAAEPDTKPVEQSDRQPDSRPTVSAEDALDHAKQRLEWLDEKEHGKEALPPVKNPANGETIFPEIPAKQPQFMTSQDRAERDFLLQNKDDPRAIAHAYGHQLAPTDDEAHEQVAKLTGGSDEKPTSTTPPSPRTDEATERTFAALKSVLDKSSDPGQIEHLENLGLATRNDVGVPRLLPAGRRALTEINNRKAALTPLATIELTGQSADIRKNTEGGTENQEVTGAVDGNIPKEAFQEQLDKARADTNTEPTDGQKKAGNYAKGEMPFGGMTLAIENPKGSERSGTGPDGKPWSRTMAHDYGYVKGARGVDGDMVDVFLTGKPDTGKAFVIEQNDPTTGRFDEYKAVLGAKSQKEAMATYLANYPDDWKGAGKIQKLTTEQFKNNALQGSYGKRSDEEKDRANADFQRLTAKPEPKVPPGTPDPTQDSALKFLAKSGGVSMSEAESEGFDRADLADQRAGIRRAFHSKGMTIETAGEKLRDAGYDVMHEGVDGKPTLDRQKTLDIIESELHGKPKYSNQRNLDTVTQEAAAEQAHRDQVEREANQHIPDWDKQPEDVKSITALADRAQRVDPEAVERALEHEDDDEVRRQLREIIGRGSENKGEARQGSREPAQARRGAQEETPRVETDHVSEHQTDFFGSTLVPERQSVPARGGKAPPAPAPERNQLQMFTPDTAPAPRGARTAIRTQLAEVGRFHSGIKQVRKWQDAAHIFAPLRKSPQESFMALALDAAGKPLAVLRHSIGDQSGAGAVPHLIMGALTKIPHIAGAYFGHNHPSGKLDQSNADIMITNKMHDLMRGSGIDPLGMIVVGPGNTKASFYRPETGYPASVDAEITRAPRTKSGGVPVVERRFKRIATPDQKGFGNLGPAQVRDQITAAAAHSGDNGLLAYNGRHHLVGHMPMTVDQMAKLRTGSKNSGISHLAGQLEDMNADAVIPFGTDVNALQNLGEALGSMGIKHLDSFLKDSDGDWSSAEESGRSKGSFDGGFYYRGQKGGGMSRDDLHEVIRKTIRDSTMRAAPDFPHVEVHQDFTTLPPYLRDQVVADGAEHTAGGLFDPNTDRIHMIADNLGSAKEATETLWHEAVGHHGLRMIMDQDRYNTTMDGIWNASQDRVRETAQRSGLDVNDLAQRRMASEEVVAYAAGRILNGEPMGQPMRNLWQRTVQNVRQFFARVTGKPFTSDKDIANLVLESKRALETGATRQRMGDIAKSARAPTFYSAVERTIEGSKQAKASADQWLATLRKTPGVKAEEMQWLGVEDWLKAHDGPVTKADLQDFIKANALHLEETVHGKVDVDQSADEKEQTRLAESLRRTGYQVSFNDLGEIDRMSMPGTEGDGDVWRQAIYHDEPNGFSTMPAKDREIAEQLRETSKRIAKVRLAHLVDSPTGLDHANYDSTRYEDYTLPGGSNYREMLLRKPMDASDTLKTVYKTGHWQEKNILAHVRFKDRTDADGKKVLFLEELQSDWHQAGRRHGYNTDEKLLTKKEHDSLIAERDALNLERDQLASNRDRVTNRITNEGRWHELSRRVEQIGARLEASYRSKGVPDAQFKTSWPALVMKRMIRHAAEGGYDRIAWTTGEQQNERYGLEKHVNLEYTPKADGTYWVHAVDAYSGNPVFERYVKPEELEDIVGREVAQKMKAGEGREKFSKTHDELVKRGAGLEVYAATRGGDRIPKGQEPDATDPGGNYRIKFADGSDMGSWGSRESAEREMARMNSDIQDPHPKVLEGDDLKTGGEGMRGFYDDILPRETNKLIGKYGGKVGETTVRTGNAPDEVLEHWQRTAPDSPFVKNERQQVHSFDITPQLRDAAMTQGFPMYWKKPSQQQLDLQREKGPGWYARVRGAVEHLVRNPLTNDFRKVLAPTAMDEESRRTARLATAALGKLAHNTYETQHALEAYSRQVDRMPPEEQLEMMDAIEHGIRQPNAEQQPIADAMSKELATWRKNLQGLGMGYLDNFIENYFPHYWADQDEAKRVQASIMGRRPLRGPASFLKMRTIPTIKEGMEAGLTPLTINPLALTLLKVREMQRFVSGVKMMEELKHSGLADFLPAGKSMPQGWKGIDDNSAKVRQWSEEEHGFIERGQYIMPENAARLINNHVGRSAIADFMPLHLMRIGSNLLNSMQLGISAFHLGFTTLDAMVSKNALAIERLTHGEPGRAAQALLEGSTPVGAVMNLRRGYEVLKAYANPSGATPDMQKVISALELGGGRVQMDRYYMASQGGSPFHGVGLVSLAGDIKRGLSGPNKLQDTGKAIANFPAEYGRHVYRGLQDLVRTTPKLQIPFELAGRAVRATSSIIMERIVPMQKLGVFSDLAQDYLRRNPTATSEQLAGAMQSAWSSVDNRLGEMVYDNLFWNRTLKDGFHLAVRAVGWNLGTFREIGGSIPDTIKLIDKAITTGKVTGDDVGHKIPYVIAMTMTTAMLGASLTYMFTGQGPQELKDYFFPPTGGLTKYGTKERVSLPSYVKDIYEYSQRPGQTVINKLNPIFGIVSDIWSNQDFFGNPIADPDSSAAAQLADKAKFVGHEAMPFSIQGQKQIAGAESQDFGGQVKRGLPFIGVAPAPGYITSPDQIDRQTRFFQEQKYSQELKSKMKKAAIAHDAATLQDLQKQYIQSRERLKQLQQGVNMDKAQSAAARHRQATSMRQHGYPATAGLVESLPLQPDQEAMSYFAKAVGSV